MHIERGRLLRAALGFSQCGGLLAAGIAQAVKAEIDSRRRVIGLVALSAVSGIDVVRYHDPRRRIAAATGLVIILGIVIRAVATPFCSISSVFTAHSPHNREEHLTLRLVVVSGKIQTREDMCDEE